MRVKKHVLFLLMVVLLMIGFPITSIASTTTSHSGIYFTEFEKIDDVDSSTNKVDKTLSDINGDRTSSKLPQTGEQKEKKVLILGLICLLVSIVVMKLEKGGNKNENKNDGFNRIN